MIETSNFREDIKDIKDNDDDYNDKEDNNKNNTYNKDNKVDCPVNSQTQTQSNKKMSGLYNHFRIDVDIYKFIVILGEGAKNSTWGYPIFYTQPLDIYVTLSFGRSISPKFRKKIKFKF